MERCGRSTTEGMIMLRIRRSGVRSGALCTVMAIGLSGCFLAGSERHEDVQRELNQNRRQWEAQGIDEYRYAARRACYCGQEAVGPVVVEVRNDEIVARTYQETDESVSSTYSGLWPTMDGVFDIVQDAIDRDAHQLRVEYHPERGFPTMISIDYMEYAIDEELGFIVEEFELLAP